MNEKAMIMKNEIRSIAKFRALLFSKRYLTVVLSIVSLYLGAMRLVVSPLYILLFLNLLPPIIIYLLKDYSKKQNHKILKDMISDHPFQLDYLKTKNKYSKLNYLANSTAYLIAMILICLWQINYNNTVDLNLFLNKIPFLTLATGLTLRFLGVFFYRFKLSYNLMHNKV